MLEHDEPPRQARPFDHRLEPGVTAFELTSLIVTLTAAAAFLNRRYLHLNPSIGVTIVAVAAGLLLAVLAGLHVPFAEAARRALGQVRFNDVLFQGLLGFLLFAGALGIDARQLWQLRGAVLTFALVSTVLSTVLVGAATHLVLGWFGLPVSWPLALLFGALISPTDPVAVLALLRSAGLPGRVQTLIAGESLFNDGIGVVLFAVLLAFVGGAGHADTSFSGVAALFAREALGGAAFGLALGYAAYLLLRQVDDYVVEVLVTLALTTGGYTLASALGVSGPLAMVMAGLLVSQLVRQRAMSEVSQAHFDGFWHLTDEILNAGLFLLVGLEVLVVNINARALLLGLIAIPVTLVARAISVIVPSWALRRVYAAHRFTRRLLIWGGLRGGIAVALAFSVPEGPTRSTYLVMTYAVVVFSIVGQGLTMPRLAARARDAMSEEPVRARRLDRT